MAKTQSTATREAPDSLKLPTPMDASAPGALFALRDRPGRAAKGRTGPIRKTVGEWPDIAHSSRSGRRLRSRSALCEVLSAPWSRSPSKPRAADTTPACRSLYMVGCVNRIGTEFWANRAAIIPPFTWGRLQRAGQGDVMQPGRADLAPSLRPPVLCLFRPDRRLLLTCSGPVKSPVPRPLQPAIGGLQSLQCHDIAGFP